MARPAGPYARADRGSDTAAAATRAGGGGGGGAGDESFRAPLGAKRGGRPARPLSPAERAVYRRARRAGLTEQKRSLSLRVCAG